MFSRVYAKKKGNYNAKYKTQNHVTYETCPIIRLKFYILQPQLFSYLIQFVIAAIFILFLH